MVYAINLSDPNIFKPAKFTNIALLLNLILPLITIGAALLFLSIFFLSAFKIITHGDNPEEIQKSKRAITFSIIGLIIVIISFLAVQLIGKMLGIKSILPT